MNIFNATSAVSNLFTQKSGKVMPPAEVKANESAKYEPTVEELSKKLTLTICRVMKCENFRTRYGERGV